MIIKNYKLKISAGFSLVEVVVAVSVAILSILAAWNVYNLFIKLSFSNPSLFQASFLAEEGIEAVKFMRDGGWTANISTVPASSPRTFVFNGSSWSLASAPSLIDGKYDRRVVFEDVYRDMAGNIAAAGSLDQNTKKVTVTVSWSKDSATSTRQITTYVSNIFRN